MSKVVPMSNVSYRHYHEEYMSNNDGTTAGEVFLLFILTIPLAFFNRLFDFVPLIQNNGYKTFPKSTMLDFIILVIPTIASLTFLADYLIEMLIVSVTLCFLLLSVLLATIPRKAIPFRKVYNKTHKLKKLPYVTYYRAITNVYTAISILAVDFKIFPVRFAKTETLGFSLMDTGVGMYVVLNALVSPEARNLSKRASLHKTCVSSLPLLVLGVIRLLVTQTLDYQQHVSEYGLHWNFFFTLAFTKVISTALVTVFPYQNSFPILSVILISFYEASLSFGLKEWILGDTTRMDFISSNREGIFSLLGYTALYFGGVTLGQILLKNDTFTLKSNVKLLLYLISVSCLFWIGTYVSDITIGVSRRLANLGYYLWTISLVLSCLSMMLFSEISFLSTGALFGKLRDVEHFVPHLFTAINFHGLLFFLLANVLTGLVNLSIKTLYAGPVESFFIIVLYMAMCCGLSCTYYNKKRC